jgi:hypothetical protein
VNIKIAETGGRATRQKRAAVLEEYKTNKKQNKRK